ncbi:recombining binding protein suppressor of hairless-like protein [Phycodurus eques]|uniref:recombining binding protein suppressor of hairless-like protein n=1 Tax=Phycodurus eques TaxID=693459 RepID=UPI002ACD2346|nr:recombining binding protein suppressor of hairless-like protein [Phycodurus eques]
MDGIHRLRSLVPSLNLQYLPSTHRCFVQTHSLLRNTRQSSVRLSPKLSGGGHVATLELHGDNFGPHLKVCFGASEADTVFKSAKSLVCVVPDVCVLRCGCRGNGGQGGRCHSGAVTVPISLRRRCDGVLYRTAFSFTYTPELRQPQRRPTRPPDAAARGTDAEGARQDDALLESIHHEFARSNFHLFMQP